MEKVFEYLRPFIRWVVRHPGKIILAFLLVSALGLWSASHLRVDNDFAKLVPSDYPSVQALKTLRDTIGGEHEVAVIIESPSFEANKQFAEALLPVAEKLQGKRYPEPYFTRSEYRKEITFLQDNALYFATQTELDSLSHYLDRQIRKAKLEANPFYFELEDEAETRRDEEAEASLRETYEELVGQEYPVSDDSTTMVLRLYPSGAQTNIRMVRDTYADLQKAVEGLHPSGFHPQMEVTLGGRLLRQLIEVETITSDVRDSFGAGVLTLLLIVVLYFFYKGYQVRAGGHWVWQVFLSELVRTPLTAIILGLPLLASLTWTFGLTYLALGTLNMMTSTLGLLLFGLGIDFGIHFYARYAEERRVEKSCPDAIEHTFMTSGQAITVVALTTSAAFYLLTLADFQGFSEYGFIAGTGILFALVAMGVFLPALVVVFEKYGLLNLEKVKRMESKEEGREVTDRKKPHQALVYSVLLLSIVAIVLALTALPGISFEYDFGALEPEYEEYAVVRRKAHRVYTDRQTRNAAYIITQTPDEALEVAGILRERVARDTLSPTIREVVSLQDRFPLAPAAQQQKLEHLAAIRDLLDDPFLDTEASEDLEKLRRAASTNRPLTVEEIPDFVKGPFLTKSGEVGNLVIIYPSVGLSDGRLSIQFSDDVGTVTTTDGIAYYAGSTSLVAADMLRLMQRETPLMVVITILLIFGVKVVFLRKLKWVLMALVPLTASFLWMFGLMTVFGIKLNFYNLVVLPTVLGIGDDSGIHIVHRYLEEGKGSVLLVLRSTGEHIAISAMTTMIGFSGLLISLYPGLRSIGQLAVIGIGMTLVAALFFVPALIQWDENRKHKKAS